MSKFDDILKNYKWYNIAYLQSMIFMAGTFMSIILSYSEILNLDINTSITMLFTGTIAYITITIWMYITLSKLHTESSQYIKSHTLTSLIWMISTFICSSMITYSLILLNRLNT